MALYLAPMHVFEPAASGRAKCRGCGQPLPKGLLDSSRASKGVFRATNVAGAEVLRATARSQVTGWMVAAFPIGWTISRLVIAALFVLVFTPVALVFRLAGRDALRLRRRSAPSFWIAKQRPERVESYLRQY